jgi:hypothetical protein
VELLPAAVYAGRYTTLIGSKVNAMANPEHLAILSQGVAVWNAWRREKPMVTPDLSDGAFSTPYLKGLDYEGSSWLHPRFDWGEYHNRRVNFENANFNNVNLERSDFTGINLASCTFDKAQLTGAKFIGAQLARADFSRLTGDYSYDDITARGISFKDAQLWRAILDGADLRDGDFTRANLHGTSFLSSDLRGADLSKSSPWHVRFDRAHLERCTFDRADMGFCTFCAFDLSHAMGLGTVNNGMCTSVGTDALQATMRGLVGEPPDRVQEVSRFLQKCGVPDSLLSWAKAQATVSDHYCSVFISYSHADEAFAAKLYKRLLREHITAWYAPEDISPGVKIHEQVIRAIHSHDKLIVILSENSMQSDWVETEIRSARRREANEHRRILFPVALAPMASIQRWECFDSDTGRDLAVDVREYFIPDFSQWEDEAVFEQKCASVLRGLKIDV